MDSQNSMPWERFFWPCYRRDSAKTKGTPDRRLRGFKHSKTMKALGPRPRAFISFLVFETPMKHSHSFLKYYFKPTETSITRTSYPVTLLIPKEGFIKEKVLRLLRTNSVKEIFETSNKAAFEQRLCKRGYPLTLVRKILAKVKFAYGKDALRHRTFKEE